MLANFSIKSLYPLALAEGEGLGTAYEYYVKRKALARFLADQPRPRSILIAGLPEKYGVSLDFLLLAAELGAKATVIDDRPVALDRLSNSLDTLARLPGAPPIVPPAHAILTDLERLDALHGQYDLVLSSEVLQRLSPAGRAAFISQLVRLSAAMALFCPNAGNEAHNTRSGLGGLRLEEMRGLTADRRPQTANQRPQIAGSSAVGGLSSAVVSSGYIDMPPFPPGITRSTEQREGATSGRFEAFVMWGLGIYAHAEGFMPTSLRRRNSHIVYAFVAE